MAILDGEFIDDKDIDPARHKFIGTFREPFSTYESVSLVFFHCGCGENLFNQQAVLDHWQRGHMDAPQYVTMGRVGERHLCTGNGIKCTDEVDGTFWISKLYRTDQEVMTSSYPFMHQVNYCPYCGAKAPKQVGDEKPHP